MKKMTSRFVLCMLLSFCVAVASAQQKRVSGTVKDEKGNPIAGATYHVKGTNISGAADDNGHFSVDVKDANAVLEFSSTNFTTKEVTVGNNNTLNVVLLNNGGNMNEVVVTALGIKRDKKVLGYATNTITSEDIVKSGNIQNPLTALYGQAPGLGIETSSSGPTGGVKINIRGNASLSSDANTRPLIVVDGIPIYDANSGMESRGYDPLNSFDYGSGINDINGEDIESIEILKGAKATVLYGSLAGNGVMMITTKKGAKTRGLGINLSLQSSLDHPVSQIGWQNEFGSGVSIYDTVYGKDRQGNRVRQLNSSRFQFGPRFDNAAVMNYDSTMTTYRAYPDNYNSLFKNTQTNMATVAISGANQFGNMRLAYTNKDYKGFLDNFYQKSNTLSFNGRINASDLASFEVVGNLYNVKTNNRYPNISRLTSNGINRDVDFKYFENFYKDELGQKRILDTYGFPYVFGGAGDGYFNMLWNQRENTHLDDKLHFVGSAKVDLKFTKTISLTGTAGVDYTDWDFTTEEKVTKLYPSVTGGKYAFARENYKIQNYSVLLNYNNTFLNNKLDVFGFFGPSYYQQDFTRLNVQTVGGLQFADWYALGASQTSSGNYDQARGSGRSSEKLSSVLGNLSLGWNGTYYLELSARNDWTSTLAPGNNSYFYPGASLSYLFNRDISIPKLKFGKLRLSVADVGRGAPSAYWAYPSYNLGRVGNTGAVTISSPGSLFAEDIKPERKREIEVGFDTRWFDKTPLEVNFSFYTATQYNQIMALGLTSSTGWSNIKINAGKVKNWGYEFYAKFTPYQDKKQKVDISFNTANQFSKVLKLYPGIKEYTIQGSGAYKISAIEGEKIGEVRAYDYLKDPQGNRIVNAGTGLYGPDNSKLVTVGNINPYLMGGFFTDYYYKNFNVHIGLNYKFGGKYLSYTNYYLLGQGLTKETLQYRDEANGGLPYYINNSNKKILLGSHTTSVPADSKDGHIYHDGVILDGVKEDGSGHYVKNDIVISATDYYSSYIHDNGEWFQPDKLFNNDYIKLREVALTYTFPKAFAQKIRFQKLALTVFGRNLFYLYKTLPNIDPESSLGSASFVEYSALPQIRTIGLKLDASF